MYGRRLALLALVATGSLLGCAPSTSLTVQLTSDLVPGVEVDRASYEITQEGVSVGTGNRDLIGVGSLGRPIRLALVEGVTESSYDVRVRLERAGAVVAQRHVRVRVAGVTITTVLVSRGCQGIACADGTTDTSTSCVGSRCEPIGCTEEHPELCMSPECMHDADCAPSSIACVDTICTQSLTCFDRPNDNACTTGQFCSTLTGCTSPGAGTTTTFDLVAGLRSNLLPASGTGTAAAQPGLDGWSYQYDPTTSFMGYGPLDAGRIDATSYRVMEMARTTGWYASYGLEIGGRGTLDVGGWTSATTDDAILVSPENSVQPVIAWRAATAGHATIDVELHLGGNPGGDVEVHVLARIANVMREIDHAYVSFDGLPDDYGQATAPATPDAPLHLGGSLDLAANDQYFVYVRVGDHDADDGAMLRGAITLVTP